VTNRLLSFLSAQILLCLLLLLVWPRPQIDDAYIFLTYARHLAASGHFAFNPGELSYGFSSPAYVLLLAGVSRITGIAVGVTSSNVLGLLLCVLAAASVWLLWGEIEQQPSSREMLLFAVLLSGPWFFTAWFLFGMETGLAVLSILGFLLWLAKFRAGDTGRLWLLIGALSAAFLAITRLESGIYITSAVIAALAASRSKREIRDVFLVGAFAGGVELAWLLYAKRTFGTYMPWTSTARLLYYLPTAFTHISLEQFHHLGVFRRSLFALKAAAHILFDGPLKTLLLLIPLGSAVLLLRAASTPPRLKWIIRVATLGLVFQLVAFAYLFPLAQSRHFAPYIAALWVLVAPSVVRFFMRAQRSQRPLQLLFAAAVIALWIVGAIHYRSSGKKIEPLRQMAAEGHLLQTDRVASEPIGILSFETQAHIIDLGGLTDRDAWPLLAQSGKGHLSDVIAWELGKGATKIVLKVEDCGATGMVYGHYCLIEANAAQSLVENR
jgi:hypothetical protein